MVYDELEMYPIDIDIKVRTLSYWARLLSVFYWLSRKLNEYGYTDLNRVWICIYIWETENVNNKERLKCVVKQRLLDDYVQNSNHQILQKY